MHCHISLAQRHRFALIYRVKALMTLQTLQAFTELEQQLVSNAYEVPIYFAQSNEQLREVAYAVDGATLSEKGSAFAGNVSLAERQIGCNLETPDNSSRLYGLVLARHI